MSPALKLQPLSIDDYLNGELHSDVKHEYVAGKVYAMAGASNAHNRLASRVLGQLYGQLSDGPCEAFNSDTKVHIQTQQRDYFYYPDAMVVCEPNPDEDSYHDRPVVLVEVLSESTRRIDEGEKRDHYLTASTLQTYVLLESDEPGARVYQRAEDETFAETIYTDPADSIPLPSIDGEIRFADVYRNTGG